MGFFRTFYVERLPYTLFTTNYIAWFWKHSSLYSQNKTLRFFQSIVLSIDSIDDIVLALEIIGWIYFPPIKYCTLILTDSNHLSSLMSCLEEGTFLAQTTPLTPPSALFEAPKAM